jgi:hypothetical protein
LQREPSSSRRAERKTESSSGDRAVGRLLGRPRLLLEEVGHAPGALDQPPHRVVVGARRDGPHQRGGIVARQARELEQLPGVRQVGDRPTAGEDDQHGGRRTGEENAQELDGRGVGGVDVIGAQDERRADRHRLQQIDHRVERLPAQLDGLEVDRRADADQPAVDRDGVLGGHATVRELLELAADGVEREGVAVALARGEAEEACHGPGDRPQRAVLMQARAGQVDVRTAARGRGGDQVLDEPRLADACLADEAHDPALAGRHDVAPRRAQGGELGLAPEQGRSRATAGLETRLGPRRPDHAVQPDGLRVVAQVDRPDGDGLEPSLDERVRRVRHARGHALRGGLHARGDVGRVAGDVLARPRAGIDGPDGDDAAVDPDPDRHRGAEPRLPLGRPRRDGVEHLQRGEDGAPRVVLVRDRIAELAEDAVAQVLRHVPLVPGDGVDADLVDLEHELAHQLRADLCRDRRRAMHVDGHHRDLPQLAPRAPDRPEATAGGPDHRRGSGLAGILGQRLRGIVECVQPPSACASGLGERDQVRDCLPYGAIVATPEY